MEFTAGLRAGAQPLISAVRAQALARLPHEGGLAARVAKERVTVSVRASARDASVTLRTSTHDSRATNDGYVRHLVYGRPDSWVRQEIPQATGWWTKTLERESPKVTPILVAAIEEMSAEIMAAGGI